MESFNKNKQLPIEGSENIRRFISKGDFGKQRRGFLKKGMVFGTLAGISGVSLLTGCTKEGEEEVTPTEDLMREHGLLNRILLIYDTCMVHLLNNEEFKLAVLSDSAKIIRTFIEDYHERLEEDYLFPRFEKANILTGLVHILRLQHKAGRILTNRVLQFSKIKLLTDTNESQTLIKLLGEFNRMYRPHEAREDTVLFPAFKKIVTKNEYFALGEDFESKEHELFGEDGFDLMVEKIANLEKQLGIYDLSLFTPQV